jgi:hypothetical protein
MYEMHKNDNDLRTLECLELKANDLIARAYGATRATRSWNVWN